MQFNYDIEILKMLLIAVISYGFISLKFISTKDNKIY